MALHEIDFADFETSGCRFASGQKGFKFFFVCGVGLLLVASSLIILDGSHHLIDWRCHSFDIEGITTCAEIDRIESGWFIDFIPRDTDS